MRVEMEISVPARAMRKFFRLISTIHLERGEYVQHFGHPDDFPSIEILLDLPGEKIVFSTESQGADHAPWKCDLSGEVYIINSGVPMKALDSLRLYLRRDALDDVIRQYEARGRQDHSQSDF